MKKIQLLIIIFIAVIVPPILWILHIYTKPLPKIRNIDKIAGPPLEYSQARLAQKEEIINEKYELGYQDELIVEELKKQPNPLYQSEDVIVTYNRTEDVFVSEVTTIRIEPAKREATNWFKEKGLSLEAICVLPVTFTINEQSAKDLRGFGVRFDPLPSECK